MTDRPTMLEGLRVLDCSRVIAGPYAAMLMGDLGADVIKLERPGRGDDFRSLRGKGMSAAFASVNRNKRGIAVDLGHPDGRRVAFELARRVDVLIENFLPGVAERQGLGYAAVSAANPGIVFASVTGFGQDGPLSRRPGYNLIAQGMSGIMALTGQPGDPPTRAGGSISDLAASYLTFGMVQAALVHRARTGRGQHLDVSLLASTIAMLPDPVAHFFDSGKRPTREGNRNPNLTPAEAYRTGDGYLNVVLLSPDQWGRFTGVLGDPVLRDDPRFATNQERLAHHAEMKARVEAVLATDTTAEWVARFEKAQIAAGPIYEFDEVFEDPQVKHLGLVARVEQPGYGTLRMVDFPVRASATPARFTRPAPLLGQHTAEVLGELGVPAEEIERLAAAGAIALG
ncbi:MAG TPA: CoA transferase [Verrucomicrobiae bacterium]|jgi:formyl-CoA transferase|nr:CoA transferase [Verrucomicrobiae bacterium]